MIGCLRVRRTESGPGVLSGGLPDAEHASSPALGRTCEGRLEIREHRLRRRGVERPPEERAAGRRRGSELDEHELMALIREGEQDRRGELLAPQLESAKGGQHRHPRQHGRLAGLEAPPGLDEAWRKEQRRHRLRDRREVLCGDRLLGCRFALLGDRGEKVVEHVFDRRSCGHAEADASSDEKKWRGPGSGELPGSRAAAPLIPFGPLQHPSRRWADPRLTRRWGILNL
jgi:hypothetical protein